MNSIICFVDFTLLFNCTILIRHSNYPFLQYDGQKIQRNLKEIMEAVEQHIRKFSICLVNSRDKQNKRITEYEISRKKKKR